MSKVSALPSTRTVHPCTLSVFKGTSGSEYSTWAHLTTSRNELPNLVTAQGSCLQIYEVDTATTKLMVQESLADLSGNVCYITTLKVHGGGPDSLLIGFSGHPRLAIVSLQDTPLDTPAGGSTMLLATSLLDMTQALIDHSLGSVTPLEQDLIVAVEQKNPNTVSVLLVLGGGVCVACLTLKLIHTTEGGTSWHANEPYILPLASLHRSVESGQLSSTASYQQSIAHGFGDILDVCFLSGYLEPTAVLLHANSNHGRTWPGRLGRAEGFGGSANALILTAISVSVSHSRSAVLWTVEVTADAQSLEPIGKSGCMVLGTNSLLEVSNSGKIQSVLALNGWAKSSCSTTLFECLVPNPWPLPKLSIQMDGSKLAFVSKDCAFVTLRRGDIYLLQKASRSWGMVPVGKSLGATGQVANLTCLPFDKVHNIMMQKILGKKGFENLKLLTGLLFAGSRLGDSNLLLYTLQRGVPLIERVGDNGAKRRKIHEPIVKTENTEEEDFEAVLRREEETLYATEDKASPDVVPPSDEEDNVEGTHVRGSRDQLVHAYVVETLTAIDSITALGPLGPGCEGPLGRSSPSVQSPGAPPEAIKSLGANAKVFPCGFGSSGGLALLSTQGRTDSTILAEADCLSVESIHSFPLQGIVLLGMAPTRTEKARMSALRMRQTDALGADVSEIDITKWCAADQNAHFVLTETTLLGAIELNKKDFMLLVDAGEDVISVEVMRASRGKLSVAQHLPLAQDEMDGHLLSMTPIFKHGEKSVTFGCVWESGRASVSTLGTDGSLRTSFLSGSGVRAKSQDDLEAFYASDKITAMDVFSAPKGMFESKEPIISTEDITPNGVPTSSHIVEENGNDQDWMDNDEYQELYGSSASPMNKPSNDEDVQDIKVEANVSGVFVAICRQNGQLQIFNLDSFGTPSGEPEPIWAARGCAHGVSSLTNDPTATTRTPRFHQVVCSELRCFVAGPTALSSNSGRIFMAVETNLGDLHVYTNTITRKSFKREMLRMPSRSSKKQAEHHSKLKRKGILNTASSADQHPFRQNRLHRFAGVSGQDGLFAATARPLWLLVERGRLAILHHQSRHVAPAGGKARPVAGFCSGLMGDSIDTNGFATVHERIGRVGSQRLTFFQGLSDVFSQHGTLQGGGLAVEKIPFGVTVHRVQFIDDSGVSSADHPLYAVLISTDLESDQSHLNDDGLSDQERKRIEDEKEAAKIKRQVEADLGGFDMEQEWVEEIEREDCFKPDLDLGGCPPIQSRSYALWIVDAGNEWNVVDSYQLEEFEHGMTLQVMCLTQVEEEPGASRSAPVESTNVSDDLFITVGTGVVDADGEDVSSKGRVLLFGIKKQDATSVAAGAQIAELSLVYEKDIFHGPVTTLSCLSCEGRSRLVIGAGADVNVEQWGKGKLTQVGFFRANMQILEIQLFKTFFLLSDAYDSLYFLVWRESDKSLTLLAKDYEPIPVFAAGVMSRGTAMTFVCHDDRQNLQFFQYAPGDPAARGGNKLVCRADIHIGCQTVSFQNHTCRSSLLVNSATPASTLAALKSQDTWFGKGDDDQRLGVNFGTSDGMFGTVLPLNEPDYWRLTALQSVIANALESDCALNPRAWRLFRRTPRRGGCRNNDRRKGVVDGDLVMQYSDLSLPDQEDLASAIGSTVEVIMDNLVEMRCSSMVI